jgi:bifunctional DNA-binding transcriptional regulator/antitoxin component of YhaV-PrlF toxin-antitoxin module
MIKLDAKNRLVLPLEIRDALGIKNNEKITFSASAGQNRNCGRITITLAKANGETGAKCSRNCEILEGD